MLTSQAVNDRLNPVVSARSARSYILDGMVKRLTKLLTTIDVPDTFCVINPPVVVNWSREVSFSEACKVLNLGRLARMCLPPEFIIDVPFSSIEERWFGQALLSDGSHDSNTPSRTKVHPSHTNGPGSASFRSINLAEHSRNCRIAGCFQCDLEDAGRGHKRQKTQAKMVDSQGQSQGYTEERNLSPRDVQSPWNDIEEPASCVTPDHIFPIDLPTLSSAMGRQPHSQEINIATARSNPEGSAQEPLVLPECSTSPSERSLPHCPDQRVTLPSINNLLWPGDLSLPDHEVNLGSHRPLIPPETHIEETLTNLFRGTSLPAMENSPWGTAPGSRSSLSPTDYHERRHTIYDDVTAMSESFINIDDFFDFGSPGG
ncbi:hypothetical protein S40293_11517 [Stachybotrys chartarum IBT 40293]|nr:hypothetical protein S40293_11517 [Stachybotrys chartarum IBT 40293]